MLGFALLSNTSPLKMAAEENVPRLRFNALNILLLLQIYDAYASISITLPILVLTYVNNTVCGQRRSKYYHFIISVFSNLYVDNQEGKECHKKYKSTKSITRMKPLSNTKLEAGLRVENI